MQQQVVQLNQKGQFAHTVSTDKNKNKTINNKNQYLLSFSPFYLFFNVLKDEHYWGLISCLHVEMGLFCRCCLFVNETSKLSVDKKQRSTWFKQNFILSS